MKKLFFLICLTLVSFLVDAQNVTRQVQNEREINRAVLRTHTAAAWGASPQGYNAGAYMHKHFKRVFPDGLTIGGREKTVVFTNAQTLTAFLPAQGRFRILTESLTDPQKRDMKNTFLSNVVALTLSVTFDEKIESFSPSNIDLGDMLISRGNLIGISVAEILEEANKTIAGFDSRFGILELSEALIKINENYLDGEITGNYLVETLDGSTLTEAKRSMLRR